MKTHETTPLTRVPIATLAVSTALLAGTCGAAETVEPPQLVTDRPDVTESSEVVTRGFVQFEIGYNFVRFELDGEKVETSTLPATLIRVGLDRKVELRIDWLGYVNVSREVDGVTTDESGSGNTGLGVKVKLREEKGAAPQLALLVDAVLPTGDRGLRTERIDPQVRLAGSHTLSERFGLGWNVGVTALSREDDTGEQHTDGIGRYSVSGAIGFGDRWGTFVELFGFIPLSGPDSSVHSFDAGFTFLTSDNVQLDLSGGVGLNDNADDWFAGAGISFRLPR
jgi:hypothetical protein